MGDLQLSWGQASTLLVLLQRFVTVQGTRPTVPPAFFAASQLLVDRFRNSKKSQVEFTVEKVFQKTIGFTLIIKDMIVRHKNFRHIQKLYSQ